MASAEWTIAPATPGPYTIGTNGESDPEHAIVSADGLVIARVYGIGGRRTSAIDRKRLGEYGGCPESAATARLLAAAPELRDALVALLAAASRIDDHACEMTHGYVEAENAARAILARLEGA